MTKTAAAHIITADAAALGDPALIIMTRDEGMGADVIEEHPLTWEGCQTWAPADLVENFGWRIANADVTEVQTGYLIVDVEKIEAPATTARVDVVTGRLHVRVPDAEDFDIAPLPDGRTLVTVAELEPWGVEEEEMTRADEALEWMGWERIGDWAEDGTECWAATVRPASR